MSTARMVLSLFAGLFAAVATIGLVESCVLAIAPIPEEWAHFMPDHPKQLVEAVVREQPWRLWWILAGWWLGCLVGGIVAAAIARPGRQLACAVVVGLMVLLPTIVNLVLLPHPAWFNVLATTSELPVAWLGGWLVTRAKRPEVAGAV